jgi:uncharacterized membrane protein (UPF0127 family)
MRFPIDVLFIDKRHIVVGLACSMPPFRFSRIVMKSHMVVELPAGALASTGTSAGDTVKFYEE